MRVVWARMFAALAIASMFVLLEEAPVSLAPEHRLCVEAFGDPLPQHPMPPAAPFCADPAFKDDPRCAPGAPLPTPGAPGSLMRVGVKLLASDAPALSVARTAFALRFGQPALGPLDGFTQLPDPPPRG